RRPGPTPACNVDEGISVQIGSQSFVRFFAQAMSLWRRGSLWRRVSDPPARVEDPGPHPPARVQDPSPHLQDAQLQACAVLEHLQFLQQYDLPRVIQLVLNDAAEHVIVIV